MRFGRMVPPLGGSVGGFGQDMDCAEEVARVATLLEAQPHDRIIEIELPDGSIDSVSAGVGAEQLREILDNGRADEFCTQDEFTFVLSHVRMQLESERADSEKKRSGKIFLGILGVGLVGMFWMTASGRGFGALGADDDVDESIAIALYEDDLAAAYCKYGKKNKSAMFRANEKAWDKWIDYTTAKKLARAGTRVQRNIESGAIACRRG